MIHLATAVFTLYLFVHILADTTLGEGQQSLLFLSSEIPATVVLSGSALLAAKARLDEGDDEFSVALENLKAQADSWLDQGPWSVTTKTRVPEGASIHDYASQAPYWWLDPPPKFKCKRHPCTPGDKQDFVWQCDGHRNPEVGNYTDHTNRGLMFNASYILTLAWYYTGNEQYALHAGDILRTWFLDSDTSMTPNLEYAQIIPCQNNGKGRSIGIIDFAQQYTAVVDAAAILALGAPGWTEADKKGFTDWNVQFLDWLSNSKLGKEEANATNNHGTFANMQIAALALFVDNKTLAKQTVNKAKSLIDSQILANGTQRLEVTRTRSWHYSNFNLGALLRFALIAQKLGINLYKHKGPEGQSLFGATDFLMPAAVNGNSSWPYQELTFVEYAATDNIRAAADAGDKKSKNVIGELQLPLSDIYLLRPAPEQLDSLGPDDN